MQTVRHMAMYVRYALKSNKYFWLNLNYFTLTQS